MNIELYIANKLCDLASSDLAITLKRQFLNPEALNTKDSQKSYSITLPATPINNEIFSHVNVEEVGDKFRIYPNARLYVGGVLILDGKFRLSEINRNGYKGNLGVPAPKSVNDIFEDTTLNNAGDWKISNFKGYQSITEYNTKENAECIFPLVLYGLLPKSAGENETYTDKNLFDQSVILGVQDFLPSVNCIEMLKKIFQSSGYNLSGSALFDKRLSNLYMSYKNPNEYEFDWGVSSIRVNGDWRHYRSNYGTFENRYAIDTESKKYVVNLFNSRNNLMIIDSDNGGNITPRDKIYMTIPRSGLYKIHLSAGLTMLSDNAGNNRRIVGVKSGNLNDAPIEIHLAKNLSKSLREINFNNKFSLDNIDQEYNDSDAIFPQPHRVNFIDPKIDGDFICGFAFGRNKKEEYRNPLNSDYCNPMAIKGGRSWDFNNGNGVTSRSNSAVYSPSYQNRSEINQNIFTVNLLNADTSTNRTNDILANGDVRQVIWLDKGDTIDLLSITTYDKESNINKIFGYNIEYSLNIEPFTPELDWLKMDVNGNSTSNMNWDDEPTFIKDQIDIMQSLPSEMKVSDWIDNFCKAFNLILYATGKKSYNLDIKDKGIVKNTSVIIDLDKRANVRHSYNQPLNLPYVYELGFTIDKDEQGFIETGKDGGGIFETGSIDTAKLTQTSTFSYCWYKDIEYTRDGSILSLPVITDKEIWEHDYDYKEMLSKQYFDKALRFWYKDGEKVITAYGEKTVTTAILSNSYISNDRMMLDYNNEPDTIASNYFTILTNEKNYTIVECYLNPEEYSNLDIALVRFNGDLYNIAEIDGYDPLNRRKATLKLIRKLL